MDEYDRWYRGYQRRRAITEAIGCLAMLLSAVLVVALAGGFLVLLFGLGS